MAVEIVADLIDTLATPVTSPIPEQAAAPVAGKRSDLPVRVASAMVMLAVAGGALWAGGWFWTGFVALVALGVLWEWSRLAFGFARHPMVRVLWLAAGVAYIGAAAAMLVFLHAKIFGFGPILTLLGAVIATDVCAYFAGRAIGGPKILPAISPSKTWAGLAGGIIGATLVLVITPGLSPRWFGFGPALAVIAQCGDFFQSWMKRRAGVKDSGNLIPGHGGLFDRVDGLMAVAFAATVAGLVYTAFVPGA